MRGSAACLLGLLGLLAFSLPQCASSASSADVKPTDCELPSEDAEGVTEGPPTPAEQHQPPIVVERGRYLLFSVNPGEGLNLARDVYLRAADLVLELNRGGQHGRGGWTLVLPPFGNPHWVGPAPWCDYSELFELGQLRKTVPVIELDAFLELQRQEKERVRDGGSGPGNHRYSSSDSGGVVESADVTIAIDELFHLGYYDTAGTFADSIRTVDPPCDFGGYPGTEYTTDGDGLGTAGLVRGAFWGRGDRMAAAKITCLEVFGPTSLLVDTLQSAKGSAVMVARFESLTHQAFGQHEYWRLRRSMVFNRRLAAIAQTFIDGVIGGGAFVSAHLRRGDFLFAHPDAIPPIRDTARQLRAALDAADSNKLFIATDARDDDLEFPQLQAWLPEVEIFLWPAGRVASLEWPNRSAPSVRSPPLTEAKASVVDQIICAAAAYFIGTDESTFTRRIQEERDFAGHPVSATYEHLCPITADTETGKMGFGCQVQQHWPPV